MQPRVKCNECNRPFLAYKANSEGKEVLMYLHPDLPCAGLKDAIAFEAVVEDELVQKKFEEIYGKPRISDYNLIAELEKELMENKKYIEDLELRHNAAIASLNEINKKKLVSFLLRWS